MSFAYLTDMYQVRVCLVQVCMRLVRERFVLVIVDGVYLEGHKLGAQVRTRGVCVMCRRV